MTISLQMWRNLSQVASYHLDYGFRDNPQPWVASQRAVEWTLPADGVPSILNGADFLIGSAEQAFIDRMIQGTLKPGKWQTITPCFRIEPQYDRLHLPYFMKLELIDYMPTGRLDSALADMIAGARRGVEILLEQFPVYKTTIALEKTQIGWDLLLFGQEIGSYGVRQFEDHLWVYGTGLAEPRFSTLVAPHLVY